MKNLAAFVMVAIFLSSVFARSIADFPALPKAQTEDPIQSIRRQYAEINRNAAKYKKVKKELSGFSTEGGDLLAYFDGPSIRKIVANFYGENGKASEEYYYLNGKLIFVLRTDYQYSKPLSGKVVRTTLNRFYFSNDKLIRWVNGSGKQVASDASEYSEKQKEHLDNSKQFTEGARSNKSKIESKQ